MICFVDSAAHLAILDPRDQHHGRTADFVRSLENPRLITSTFVLSEVVTRGTRLVGAWKTSSYLRMVLSNPAYRIVEIGLEVLAESLDALVKYADQKLSFTDCTSVLIMRGTRIKTIFTFDEAFRRLGFKMVP